MKFKISPKITNSIKSCVLGSLLAVSLIVIISTSCKDISSSIESEGYGSTSATIPTQDIREEDKKREELFKELTPKNIDNTEVYDDKENPEEPPVEVFEGDIEKTTPEEEATLDATLAELRKPYNPLYRINRGDQMEISIPFEPDSRQIINVRPDGTLGYLYGVEVKAAGLTYPELQTKIEKQLEKYYYKPKIDINGKTFSGSQVFIMGPIQSPGGHIVQNNTKLLDFLSMAGVLSKLPSANLLSYNNSQTNDVVDLKNSYMMRDGKILPIDFYNLLIERDMRYNILVRANDFLFFPSSYLSDISKSVYVIGAVVTPRSFQYTTATTFMSAIAAAGGVDKYRADRNHVAIIRKSSDKIITVNYNSVIKGEEPDIELQDKDIIYIPERGLYSASKWTTTIIGEIIAPLQAIIQASSASKAVNMHDWHIESDFGPTDYWMNND